MAETNEQENKMPESNEVNNENKETTKGIKFWWKYLCGNVKNFCKHPKQYVKGYIEDFKEADTKGKIKKVLLTALGVFIVYRLIIIAVILFVFMIIIGSYFGQSDAEYFSKLFYDKHGRWPESDYEMYNDEY
ncbi:MAG: hypothetical protein PHC41_08075 [Lachnospiraceae bacterium]|nr:hypothetical protein [Lachnospiraceae bacterium]MDD3616172.1 hypothetical protein [Lachnospiraceae bacterium]